MGGNCELFGVESCYIRDMALFETNTERPTLAQIVRQVGDVRILTCFSGVTGELLPGHLCEVQELITAFGWMAQVENLEDEARKEAQAQCWRFQRAVGGCLAQNVRLVDTQSFDEL